MNKIVLSALLTATCAFADDKGPAALTPEQVKAVEEIVLKQINGNPEIIVKSVQQYAAKEQQAEEQKQVEKMKRLEKAVESSKDELVKTDGAIVVGDNAATVKIVVFLDPNCGYCRTFEKNINIAKEGFKNLQIFYRHFPILGEASNDVARGLIAADFQKKFPALSTKIAENSTSMNKEKFLELAQKEEGLKLAQLKEDMDGEKVKSEMKFTQDLAKKLEIDATPTMIIIDKKGARLIDGIDVDTLKQTLEKASA